MEIAYLQKLDTVLRLLIIGKEIFILDGKTISYTPNNTDRSIKELLFDFIKEHSEDTQWYELQLILDMLVKDEYVTCKERNTIPAEKGYLITYRGLVFIKQNGYVGKQEKEHREKEKLKLDIKLAKETIDDFKSTKWLSIIAISISIVAIVIPIWIAKSDNKRLEDKVEYLQAQLKSLNSEYHKTESSLTIKIQQLQKQKP